MTKQIYINHDGDLYTIELDTELRTVRGIWRYHPKARREEFCVYKNLDQTLKDRIDDALIRTYGEPDYIEPNGNSGGY